MIKKKLNPPKKIVSYSIVIAAVSFLFYAYEDGITGKTLKSSEPGCTCHSEENSAQVNVIIDGPDQLIAGETAEYTVSISGGPLTRGGTNIAVSSGTLIPGNGMQRLGAEITHTEPKEPAGGEVIFNFMYTAPNHQATVTMFANGNSVNFSGTEFGDAWNFAESKIIIVNSVAGADEISVKEEFFLLQNYPNPFNPSTRINFNIDKQCFVSLKIYNSLGEKIAEFINEIKDPGMHEFEFDVSDKPDISGGVYIYTLEAGEKNLSGKMLLLK